MTLHVVAHFHIQAGLGDRVEALLADVVEPTAGEDGCLEYQYYRDNDDLDHFVFIEQWRDDASLDAHLARSHVTSMLAAVQPLLASPIQGTRLTKR